MGILVLGVSAFLVMPLLLLPVLAAAVALEGGSGTFGAQFEAALSLESVTPAAMLYLNLTLASLTLVCMGIVRVLHRMRPRWLSSVLPGMRWKFFLVCFGLAIIALIASLAVGAFIPSNPNDLGGEPNKMTGTLVATGIVILLTTPLQAIGEEYAFRGYLMQAFGSFTHGIMEAIGVSRVWAVRIALSVALLFTSGLFGLAHGAQNFPLFFDRFAFGLMAGLTVILVGGLEAGIALAHPEQPARLRRGDRLRRPGGCADGLRGVLVAAAADPRPERRLPRAGAARGTPDGADQQDHSAGCRARRLSASRARQPVVQVTLPRLVGAAAFVYSQPSVRHADTTVNLVTASHGVWGNWQPDWFWSS